MHMCFHGIDQSALCGRLVFQYAVQGISEAIKAKGKFLGT